MHLRIYEFLRILDKTFSSYTLVPAKCDTGFSYIYVHVRICAVRMCVYISPCWCSSWCIHHIYWYQQSVTSGRHRYTHVRMYKCRMHVCVYESLLIFGMMYSSYIFVPAKCVTRSYLIYINTHACLQYARVYFWVLANICQYVFIIYIGTSKAWQGVALYTFVCMYVCSMHVWTYECVLRLVMY